MNYILNAYVLQDIGHRSNQEDCFYPPFIDPCHYDETSREGSYYDGTPHTDDRLFIVCDGMGGHARGEVAARIVTQTMSRAILSAASIEGSFNDEMIRDAVKKSLKKLVAEDDPKEIKKMGTTMAVLKFHANGATVGHIGDTRVYHFRPARKNQPAQILFKTKDHTVLEELVSSGKMTYEQAKIAQSKHVLSRSMTSAENYKPEVEIDHISDIQKGDVFMLCTDGVFENMNDDQLCNLLTDPNIADVQRVQSILHECLDNTDNHTAIVIRVQDVLNTSDEKTYNAALAPGTVLKSKNYTYHIEKVLGKGAFGITYLVNTAVSMQGQLGTIHTGVQVALKEFYMPGEMKREGGELITISPESKVKAYAEKFRREASRLAMLSHPNIVRVLEVFEANNTIYYSMEYLSGGSLNDYVVQKGSLPEQEAIGYIRQIGSALLYLHTNKMLHLDIKPSNIMLSQMSGMLKLIDFGLSKQYTSNDSLDETSTNLGVGTTGYAPLEQADQKGEREFAPTLDVYALGATYYKLLTGHTPASAISVLNRGLNTLPLVKKKVSQQSILAIKAAMEPLQANRCQSVDVFLNMLPRVDDETIFAPKKKHRMRYWVLLVTVLLCIGILFDPWQSSDETTDEELPNMESVVVSNFDMPMVSVEGGSFLMGCDDKDNPDVDPDEHPVRYITVSSFYMGKYEVTQGLWRAVMEGGDAHKSKNDHYPVVNVTWKDIQTFIKRLNKKTGRRFRLPTEAEWEYAARGGNLSQATQYSGSSELEEVAWFSGNSGDRLHPVGRLKPNELGIFDLSGNVWEICSDWYGDYQGDSLRNPMGCEQGYYHVIRGGDWNCSRYSCRVSCRQDNSLQSIGSHIGLRLVETK